MDDIHVAVQANIFKNSDILPVCKSEMVFD